MGRLIRIALAQLKLEVGNLQENVEKHLQAIKQARDELSADVIVFPELSTVGYPAEDFLLRPGFIHQAELAFESVVAKTHGIHALVGHIKQHESGLLNACSMIYNGKVIAQYAKKRLPNYGVFDEARYFVPGHETVLLNINDIAISCVICEDLWSSLPCKEARQGGAEIILAPNASPFEVDKCERRIATVKKRVEESHGTIVYVNQVGGQDDLIFDGGSFVMDNQQVIRHCSGWFNENIQTVDLNMDEKTSSPGAIHTLPKLEKIYRALTLSTHDYIRKNNFPGALVGLSGGIDSALVLCIAVDAIGNEQVEAVTMPSPFTAEMSITDSYAIAKNLGVHIREIPIHEPYQTFLSALSASFKDTKNDVTEENIQARCRAIILMALSNKFGKLVLTTGNRSEIAVGYCTLYGDMAGGFDVLKDVPKTLVYELAKWRNEQHFVIPERVLTRAPTAELAFNQTDQDTLPPYKILDEILQAYINDSKSMEEIIALGFDANIVERMINLLRRNEYKRKQAPLGPRINHKSFIRDWRYPVTENYKK